MKPAWDQLGDEFKSSSSVVIGDVDCTKHQSLCSEYGVKGYPTIKYYNGEWNDYQGGRDFDSLKSFASESLGPSCSYPDNKDLCSAEEITFFEEWMAKGGDAIKKEIKKHEKKIKKLNSDFDKKLEKLQKTYESNEKKRDNGVKAAKKPLSMLNKIKL